MLVRGNMVNLSDQPAPRNYDFLVILPSLRLSEIHPVTNPSYNTYEARLATYCSNAPSLIKTNLDSIVDEGPAWSICLNPVSY